MVTNKRSRKQMKSTVYDQKTQNKSTFSEQVSYVHLCVILNFELTNSGYEMWSHSRNKEPTDKQSGECREYLNLLSVRINTGKICFADGLRYS